MGFCVEVQLISGYTFNPEEILSWLGISSEPWDDRVTDGFEGADYKEEWVADKLYEKFKSMSVSCDVSFEHNEDDDGYIIINREIISNDEKWGSHYNHNSCSAISLSELESKRDKELEEHEALKDLGMESRFGVVSVMKCS